MRHTISILLLGVFCFPLAGHWLLFALRKYQIRENTERLLRAGVSEEQLVLVRLPDDWKRYPGLSFQRMHAREFKYQGVMYDVVRQARSGDTTLYWCVADYADTELHRQWEACASDWAHKDPANRKANERLRLFWQELYLPAAHEQALWSAVRRSAKPFFGYKKALDSSYIICLFHPPEAAGALAA